jgi:hypothetical protein
VKRILVGWFVEEESLEKVDPLFDMGELFVVSDIPLYWEMELESFDHRIVIGKKILSQKNYFYVEKLDYRQLENLKILIFNAYE